MVSNYFLSLERYCPFSEYEKPFLNAGYQDRATFKEGVGAPRTAEARTLLVGRRIEESYLDWILRVGDVQYLQAVAIVSQVGKSIFQIEIVGTCR